MSSNCEKRCALLYGIFFFRTEYSLCYSASLYCSDAAGRRRGGWEQSAWSTTLSRSACVTLASKYCRKAFFTVIVGRHTIFLFALRFLMDLLAVWSVLADFLFESRATVRVTLLQRLVRHSSKHENQEMIREISKKSFARRKSAFHLWDRRT